MAANSFIHWSLRNNDNYTHLLSTITPAVIIIKNLASIVVTLVIPFHDELIRHAPGMDAKKIIFNSTTYVIRHTHANR